MRAEESSKESIMQDGKYCFLCGRNGNGDPLDKHHCLHGPNRKKADKLGLWVWLCHDRCHETGPYAVHNNGETDLYLKQQAQKACMRRYGWTTIKFRKEFGKNYLDIEKIMEEEGQK